MDLDKSIYIYIYSIYIPGYIPGYIYKIYVPGYIYLGYIYHLYIRYIPGHIYQDIYIWGFSPNKNTLDPLRDGINLSIKVPKGALIWHSTVTYINQIYRPVTTSKPTRPTYHIRPVRSEILQFKTILIENNCKNDINRKQCINSSSRCSECAGKTCSS